MRKKHPLDLESIIPTYIELLCPFSILFHFGTETLSSAKKRAKTVIAGKDVSREQALPAPSRCLQHLPPVQLEGAQELTFLSFFLYLLRQQTKQMQMNSG